jgi:hypothetical protein
MATPPYVCLSVFSNSGIHWRHHRSMAAPIILYVNKPSDASVFSMIEVCILSCWKHNPHHRQIHAPPPSPNIRAEMYNHCIYSTTYDKHHLDIDDPCHAWANVHSVPRGKRNWIFCDTLIKWRVTLVERHKCHKFLFHYMYWVLSKTQYTSNLVLQRLKLTGWATCEEIRTYTCEVLGLNPSWNTS